MKKVKAQFNFAWIFAIVVGGAILFLAIFGAMKAGDTYRYQSDTEIAKSLSVITDPLQSGFSEGSFGKISFGQETRINNICFEGGFGKNDISVSTRSEIGEEWNLPGGATSIHNKYFFSSEKSSGLDYYVFSKSFNFPYEISDLIFLTSDNYCFLNAPDEVADEIIGMNIENIEIEHPTGVPLGVGFPGSTSDGANCTLANSVKVCFGSGPQLDNSPYQTGQDCDVMVYGSCSSGCDSVYDEGTVSKSGGDMKYVGNLMYAAIFSDKLIYDCNVKRLMYRAGRIAEEFFAKADLMDARGCNTNLGSDLAVWSGLTGNATSDDLIGLRSMADSMESKNDRELCGVW